MTLKEAAFEPSSPIRLACKLGKLLSLQNLSEKPIYPHANAERNRKVKRSELTKEAICFGQCFRVPRPVAMLRTTSTDRFHYFGRYKL